MSEKLPLVIGSNGLPQQLQTGDVPISHVRSSFSNADFAIPAQTTIAAQIGTLTATRNVTLPAAATVNAGRALTVLDESGSASQSSYLTLTPASGDTINGLTAPSLIVNAYGYVVLQSNGVTNWTVIDASSIVLTFSATGNSSFPIPNNGLNTARVIGIGSGAGGGSGRRGQNATVRGGGGGGSGGTLSDIEYPLSVLLGLGTSFAVSIPVGGTGAAATTTDDSNGSGGGTGGQTTLTIGSTLVFFTAGGNGGQGGTTAAGAGGTARTAVEGMFLNGVGGAGGTGAGLTGVGHSIAGAGGGGGGGSNSGGNGGTGVVGSRAMAPNQNTVGGGTGSSVGTNGNNGSVYEPAFAGQSGGGGGGGQSGAGGNGGNGARGSGGGGGGASLNGFASGAGGNGGPGYLRIHLR